MSLVDDWRVEGGKRLSGARKAKGLTLRELSNLVPSCSVSRIHGFERGARGMTPDVATTLGSILGVTAAHLLCVEPSSDELKRMAKELEASRDLVRKFDACSPVVKEIVRDLIDKYSQAKVVQFPDARQKL